MIDVDRPGTRARLVAVVKPGGMRWLTVLGPRASASYAAAVAAVAGPIEASLPDGAVANRVASARGSMLRLEPWLSARARFLLEARQRAAACGALLLADVRDCYPSIRPPTVEDRLLAIGCPHAAVRDVVHLLSDFESEGVRGLPVGPEPSAVLANAVLAVGDDAVARCGAPHLRWVDDFVVFADDCDHALSALGALRAALAQVGLSLSGTKTQVVEDQGAIRKAMAFSAISGGAARYHRRARAHALPRLEDLHALPSADGGVGPRRRTTRGAGRDG